MTCLSFLGLNIERLERSPQGFLRRSILLLE